jgi:spore maturation protein CgeB
MKILYIGELYYGSTCLMRKDALVELGYKVNGINIIPNSIIIRQIDRMNYKFSYALDFEGLNKKITNEFKETKYDIVWIDKGKKIFPKTLERLKEIRPDVKLVHINPDDPFGKFRTGWGTFVKAIPYYDYHFVAREVNVAEYKFLGAKKVFVYDRSYDPHIHRPIVLNVEEKKKYICRVGFIGSWAIEREKSIAYLIKNGIDVAVWGNGWQDGSYWELICKHYRGPGLQGLEYTKAINGMEIALHFLRRENRDEQDSRTFEIPACGTFMIAERSKKHEEFFTENEEAVFFNSEAELLSKIKLYLNNKEMIQSIAEKGYQRTKISGYSHKDRLNDLLKIID